MKKVQKKKHQLPSKAQERGYALSSANVHLNKTRTDVDSDIEISGDQEHEQ